MKEADPRAHVERLMGQSNYLGAYLYLKELDIERAEYVEIVGIIAGSVADELSRTRRDDKERIVYLRSILAWILRDVPGLGSLYREQLRETRPNRGVLGDFSRGWQNAGDVVTGRKTVSEGFREAADDVRRGVEDAADAVKSGDAGSRVNEFLSSAESGIRQGLDQLGEFFRAMNDRVETEPGPEEEAASEEEAPSESDAERAARADSDMDVEDVPFESEDEGREEN